MIKKQYKQSQDHRQLSEFVNEKTINALEELSAGEEKKMATLKETAQAYTPQQTKNIADLEEVNIEAIQLEDREGTDNEGKPFKYKVIISNGEDYRVPGSVIGQIHGILEKKTNLKRISVSKTGQGMQTRYTVIPIE